MPIILVHSTLYPGESSYEYRGFFSGKQFMHTGNILATDILNFELLTDINIDIVIHIDIQRIF